MTHYFVTRAFWQWVKQHCRLITDRDLGAVLRVLSGREGQGDDDSLACRGRVFLFRVRGHQRGIQIDDHRRIGRGRMNR